jgi:C4-dicarboxylate-specific signal transduction histidine kinase
MLDKDLFVRFTIAPVLSKNMVLGYCLYFIDESEAVLKEIEIHNRKEVMISSSKLSSLGEMAAGIAHEINNPLTVINGTMMLVKKMLKKDMEPHEFDKIEVKIDKVLSTVTRASKIIAGQKAFSSASEGKEYQKLLLTNVLDDVLNLCQERIKYNKIEFNYENNVENVGSKLTQFKFHKYL